jgi:hypothetical protein
MAMVLSILVLAVVVLVIGAVALWRRGGSRRQVGLMLLLALIAAINVAIWTVPDENGQSPLQQGAPE